ncbi:beta-mannosidase [Burkholderia savannae]|uniref:glycoside hydrolase family 2 protein n=1 Tax=Burkholderia savannae TaxID=1637837 RepID=UPI00076420B4|nr:glycoside hydrolase family 2 protein [Burkholderia savannae]KWZ40708.1 beta-mannosidase [Burkholderia savannae]
MKSAPDRVARSAAQWTLIATPAGAIARPSELSEAGWCAAPVPGTVAQALAGARRFDPAHPYPLGDSDYWYRTTLHGAGPRIVRLNGLATIAEVWLDDALLLCSDNMYVAHDIAVTLGGANRLALCFRSLERHLAAHAPRGRARWRTRLVDTPALRGVRTTFLGRMPGWFPAIEPIGPWRSIEIVNPAGAPTIVRDTLRATLDGRDGVLDATLEFAAPLAQTMRARLVCGAHAATLETTGPRTARATLRIPNVMPWWPHTHGEPKLYDVGVEIGDATIPLARTGFRTIAVERGGDGRGFALSVNGTPVFARGACWTSADPLGLQADPAAYRRALALARDAGCNMIRVGGTMTYEADAFYALCDELGLLVWQDFMLANFDYPSADPRFAESLKREAEQFLGRHAARPSIAVLCGGSEIAQQAAMVGLAPDERRVPATEQLLAELCATHRPDAIYVADSPHGGVLPFAPREGVAHYYGVGAYLRPPEDARRAGVRFASECLAFANVPCDATLASIGSPAAHEPSWKRAVPRDPGAPWDFDDVRDHYLRTLYGVEPARLRSCDPARYLTLSRAIVADLIAQTLSEWRRVGSSCAGALVWQFQDVMPGAGWGLVDAHGRPKSAWHALKRVSQPRQILLTDEGLNGLDVHVLNDAPTPLDARIELVALRDGKTPIARAGRTLRIDAHAGECVNSADLLGRFFDFTYAYRFGPREHDVVIASLYAADGALLSQAFHFPERTAPTVFERADIGLEASAAYRDGRWCVDVQTRTFARYVHVSAPGLLPDIDWFHLAPGAAARIELAADPHSPHSHDNPPDASAALAAPPAIEVRALNSNKTIRPRIEN